jgi:hypothetical protein
MLKCFGNLPVGLALAVAINTGGLASAEVLRIGGTAATWPDSPPRSAAEIHQLFLPKAEDAMRVGRQVA